ncbi:hypothetical protein [Labilibaculum euxinus]
MRDILKEIETLTPLSEKNVDKRVFESSNDIFNTLKGLSEENKFPKIHIDYLTLIEDVDQRNKISKKLLNILLFAKSNITSYEKLHDWFLKGKIPRTSFYGINSMNYLTASIEKFNSLQNKIDKNADKVTDYHNRLTKKSNKNTSEALKKSEEKYFEYEDEKLNQQFEIEDVIFEIESKLAIGRKL